MKLVAFIDILGFKDIVDYNNFKELTNIYGIFEKCLINAISLLKFKRTSAGISIDFDNCNIEAIQISDSIILWSKEKSLKSYFYLILIVREFLSHGIYSGLPLRACIDYGEFGQKYKIHAKGITTNTFFGKAITSAYRKSESQSWSGGYITKEAIDSYCFINSLEISNEIKEFMSIKSLQDKHLIKKFMVPLKDDYNKEVMNWKEEYCLNWVSWLNPKISKDLLIQSFTKFNKTLNKRAQIILDNTIYFWNHALQD